MLFLWLLDLARGGTPDPKIRKKLLQNYDPKAQPYPSPYRTKTTVTIPYLNVIHYDVVSKAYSIYFLHCAPMTMSSVLELFVFEIPGLE